MSKTPPVPSGATTEDSDAQPKLSRAASHVPDPETKAASRYPAPEPQLGVRGHGADKKPFTVWLPIDLVTELRDLSKHLKRTAHKNEGSVEALAQAAFRAEIDRWNKRLEEK